MYTYEEKPNLHQRKQQKHSKTGIPPLMQERFENYSGLSLDNVRIHYNSAKPSELHALAYTQGNHVYIRPGQDKHLGHELGHVIQQKSRSIPVTMNYGGQPLNMNPAMEHHADVIDHDSRLGYELTGIWNKENVSGVAQLIPDLSEVAVSRVYDLLQISDWMVQEPNYTNIILKFLFKYQAMFQSVLPGMRKEVMADYLLTLNVGTLQNLGLSPMLLNSLNHVAKRTNGIAYYIESIRNYYNINVPNPVQGLQTMESDVGKVSQKDPRVPHQRKVVLGLLEEVLRQELLTGPNPLIENAIAAGDRVEAAPPPIVRNADGTYQPTPVNVHGSVQNVKWGNGISLWQRMKKLNILGGSWLARAKKTDILAGAAQFDAMVHASVPQITRNKRGTVKPPAPKLRDAQVSNRLLGAAMSVDDTMEYGLAAGRSQTVHEYAHLMENQLGVNDFVMLHNFLAARTRTAKPNGLKTVAWNNPLLIPKVDGYDAELPPMIFQNALSRSPLVRSGNSVVKFLLENTGNYLLSLGVRGGSRLLKLIPGVRGWLPAQDVIDKRAQRFIDDFFLQDSNSEATSYATFSETEGNYRTEFLSTTAELLSTVRGTEELITTDPLRAALFLYLTNRDRYNAVNTAFQTSAAGSGYPNMNLDNDIHVIT